MRRIFKTGIVVILLIAGIGVGALEYANRLFLPTQGRQWVETAATEAIGRKVTVGRIRIHPWHGALLEQISIEEDSRYGKEPFLTIDQISGSLLYLPIFKDRQLIVPTLRIVRPKIRLIQDPNGIWNTGSLQPAKRPGEEKKRHPPLQLLIPKVVVTDGQLEAAFLKVASPFRIRFQGLDAEAHLLLPSKIQGSVRAFLSSNPPSELRLEGTFSPEEGTIQLEASASFPLETIREQLPSEWTSGIPSMNGSASVDLTLTGPLHGPWIAQGALETKGLHWKTGRIESEGDLRANVNGPIPPLPAKNPFNGLRGTVALDRLTLRPIPEIGQLREVTGELQVSSEGIRTEELTATLPTGERLVMSGSILNDDPKTISLTVKSTLAVTQIPSLFPTVGKQLKEVKGTGQVEIEAVVQGQLKPTISSHPTVTAILQGVNVEFPSIDPIRQVTGRLRWQPEMLNVTDLTGQFLDQPFHLEGSLVNFAQPEIDAQLSWGRLQADLDLAIDGERIEVQTATGRYGEGSFRIVGEITGWKEPVGNLYADLGFKLEELPGLFPKPPAWAADFPWKGPVSARLLLTGPLSRPGQWGWNLKASCPTLTYRQIPLEQAAIDLRQEQGKLTLNSAKATLAGGTVTLTGSMEVNDPERPWNGRFSASAVNLETLARILNWKTKNLSGDLFIEWRGTGNGSHLASLQGPGTVQVRGGRILELPFLGDFADLLKIPSLRTIVFEQADGPFTLENGQIRTDAFQIKTPQATLTILGSGGFLKGLESPIRWRILPTLSPELIPEESRSKVGRAIAKGTSYLVGEIQVTGTWKDPKRTVIPKPITQILNEQLFNLQDLVKEWL